MEKTTELKPVHRDFLNPGMRELWESMRPDDLEDFIHMGGTALAMYLNHRESEDFDFFTTRPLDIEEVRAWKWLQGAKVTGNRVLIDVRMEKHGRTLKINLVDTTGFRDIKMKKKPSILENGTKIAHPLDVIIGKLGAVTQRKATRDYVDLATCYREVPGLLKQAIAIHLEEKETSENTPEEIARNFRRMSWELEYSLSEENRNQLELLNQELVAHPEQFQKKD